MVGEKIKFKDLKVGEFYILEYNHDAAEIAGTSVIFKVEALIDVDGRNHRVKASIISDNDPGPLKWYPGEIKHFDTIIATSFTIYKL